jgi:hypothetical protein
MFRAPLLLPVALFAQTTAPVRSVPDPGVVTTRQAITPAGVPAVFSGRVTGVDFGGSASEIWVLGNGFVSRLDWRQNRALQHSAVAGQPGLQGIRFSPHLAGSLFAVVRDRGVHLYRTGEKAPERIHEKLGTQHAGAIAIAAGRNAKGVLIAAVPLIYDNELAVLNAETGQKIGSVKTGIAPFGVVLSRTGDVAWVSNWGGKPPGPNEMSAPTGYAPNADRVVVDARGVAASGTLMRIDLNSLTVTGTVAVDPHPTALAWDEARERLYAASGNRDTVSVVDTAARRLLRTMPVQPFREKVKGIAPTAIRIAANGARLLVACGGINAVVIVEASSGKIEGMIPTAWYPSSLALSGDGAHLAVGSLLGMGSGWREAPSKRFVHAIRGAVHVVAMPDAAQLASYTSAVFENNRMSMGPALPAPSPDTRKAALPVPERAGEPSLIDHVVYIIKENRTYDQLFGDLRRGNGDPSLVMFGEDVTPNQRRLAEQFVLLDNFYATGGNSADGHQWATQANENPYAMWPGYLGRSYPFDGSDPLAISESGFLWTAALNRGKTVRIYGEYAGITRVAGEKRKEYLDRWRRGERFSNEWQITSPVASMNPVLARQFPAYSTSIPDVVRASIFIEDVRGWEKEGKMPNLVLVQLPSDHTVGNAPLLSTPKAMVADNDLALGQIVEALSKTPFWKKMAIFVVEDDAQNGVDHVDGHRTVALAISPYIRRGSVDSTFYSTQSMLKTIELMLGLPTLSLFDLIANDMRASFTAAPDFTAYQAAQPKQSLFETNPPAQALRGEERKAALASVKMKWHLPDAAPSDRLNRILWAAIKGWNVPYPGVKQAVFAPLTIDLDDDER